MMKKHNALIPDSPCEVQLIKLPGTSFHQDLYWDVHVCPSCLALVFSLDDAKHFNYHRDLTNDDKLTGDVVEQMLEYDAGQKP